MWNCFNPTLGGYLRGGGRTETRAGIETEAADFYVEFLSEIPVAPREP